MEGLIKEKKSFAKEKPSEDILGFYNLHAAQKVERYEITSYEGLIEAAQHMGMDEAVDLLQQNLDEEERTLDLLKQLASDYEVEQEEDEDTDRRKTRRGEGADGRRRPEALSADSCGARPCGPAPPRPRELSDLF